MGSLIGICLRDNFIAIYLALAVVAVVVVVVIVSHVVYPCQFLLVNLIIVELALILALYSPPTTIHEELVLIGVGVVHFIPIKYR